MDASKVRLDPNRQDLKKLIKAIETLPDYMFGKKPETKKPSPDYTVEEISMKPEDLEAKAVKGNSMIIQPKSLTATTITIPDEATKTIVGFQNQGVSFNYKGIRYHAFRSRSNYK